MKAKRTPAKAGMLPTEEKQTLPETHVTAETAATLPSTAMKPARVEYRERQEHQQ
jgi:hypothetical protein